MCRFIILFNLCPSLNEFRGGQTETFHYVSSLGMEWLYLCSDEIHMYILLILTYFIHCNIIRFVTVSTIRLPSVGSMVAAAVVTCKARQAS